MLIPDWYDLVETYLDSLPLKEKLKMEKTEEEKVGLKTTIILALISGILAGCLIGLLMYLISKYA